MSDFKIGDLVMLASGGPVMTIYDIQGKAALCEWMDKNHKSMKDEFSLTSLVHHDMDMMFFSV